MLAPNLSSAVCDVVTVLVLWTGTGHVAAQQRRQEVNARHTLMIFQFSSVQINSMVREGLFPQDYLSRV